MKTAYALVGLDGEVHAVVYDRQQIVDYLASDSLGALYSADDNIVEFNLNDDPITERGEALKELIRAAYVDDRILKLHLNKSVAFYELHIDDRLQTIHDIIYKQGVFSEENTKPLNFNDSHWKD